MTNAKETGGEMTYLPDIIERLESSAERQYEDMLQPDGMLKCFCGNLFKEGEGDVLSPNPYAMPSCPNCVDKALKGVTNAKRLEG